MRLVIKKRAITTPLFAFQHLLVGSAAAALLFGLSASALADGNDGLLDKLRAKGILTDAEYQQLKATGDGTADGKTGPLGENTTLGGTLFLDATHITQTNNGTKAASSGSGVDVKRGYLAIDHKFDNTWAANVTTDFNYVAADAETQLFIKKAYVQSTISDALAVRAGSADMPWIPFVESLYGYRFIENTLIDRLKFGNSADWGLHAMGKAGNNGALSYAFSGVGGNGYKNPTRSEHIDWEGRIAYVPITGVTLALGGYSGDLGKNVAGTTTPVQHTAKRLDAIAAYVNPTFRVGVESFRATNWGQVTTVAEDKSEGYSYWGAYNFTPTVAAFARYDSAKPLKTSTPNYEDQYYNLGLAYNARKNIDIALAYKHENVKNSPASGLSTSNGTIIGGTTADGKYNEVGLWAQVKF